MSIRLGIRLALIAAVAFSALAAAGLVHLRWQGTAERSVRDLAEIITRQTAASVARSFTAVLADAEAAREALRSLFFQGVVDMRDEAKREFVFLSALRSQPNLSWIAFGFPDGGFFGAHKPSDDRIQMVEVDRAGERQRIDTYEALPGDIAFLERRSGRSAFDARAQPWFAAAEDADGPAWAETTDMPTTQRPGITTATPLLVYGERVGILAVNIEFARLSRFLTELEVGRTGAAFVLDPAGRILAGPAAGPGAFTLRAVAGIAWARYPGGSTGMVQLEIADEHGTRFLAGLSPLSFGGWTVVTLLPADDILAEIERDTAALARVLAAFVLLVTAVAALLVDRLVSRPLRRIARQLRHVEAFELDRITRTRSPLRELSDLSATMAQMAQGLSAFRKFIPVDLVRRIVSQGIEARPGGNVQDLTVLFADLAGFTSLSERLGQEVVPRLAAHLGRMSAVIHQEGGTIDKFIGDAVMAFWNAPEPCPDHALRSCRAALAAQAVTAREGMGLRMRIGINTGPVLVGNIGAEDRLNYTAIGDAVNLASRLEALNKLYGTEIILGEETALALGERMLLREIDTVAVYGRRGETRIYELVAEVRTTEAADWIAAYEAALAAYRASDWERAVAGFRDTIRRRGGDGPAELMIDRCLRYRSAAPAGDWTGVHMLDTK